MLSVNNTRVCLSVVLVMFLSTVVSAEVTKLENKVIRVELSNTSGCFTVTEKATGHVWQPDPWEGAAAALRVRGPNGQTESWNLSKCRKIDVTASEKGCVQVTFRSPVAGNGQAVVNASVVTQLRLAPDTADLEFSVLSVTGSSGYFPTQLEFPARHFSLITQKDRGMAVIPYVQGVVVPSYSFPMRNSKFGISDDYQHYRTSIGELALYGWSGLSMPWFGTCTDTSGVVATIPTDESVRLQFILNYNDKVRFNQEQGIESPYPRILALTPVWSLHDIDPERTVRYHFIPRGNHVAMAKYYRTVAKKRGLFVSLREKAKQVPGVEKMRGDIYLHVYGGFPHYVNFPDMEFTFEQLEEIIRDLHDNLHVKKAFITAWGTWENYPPYHWPINKQAGGEKKLKEVVDLAETYGYLFTPYHNWHALLEHDPNYDVSLLPRRVDGKHEIGGRWSPIDRSHWHHLAQQLLPKEFAAIGSNAIYTDGPQTIELLAYLKSLGLPVTKERGADAELWVPYIHRSEGMAPFNLRNEYWTFIHAPLFNLVYGDAILTTNRWQSPDNDYDLNGDYAVRVLRNMLYGNEPMFVVPPWEYPGIREYIRHAVNMMAPLHEETAFEELVDHQFLSDDLSVQQSRFSGGTEVTVNLGLVDQPIPNGTRIPGRGFRIRHADGSMTQGCFKTTLEFKTPTTIKETRP